MLGTAMVLEPSFSASVWESSDATPGRRGATRDDYHISRDADGRFRQTPPETRENPSPDQTKHKLGHPEDFLQSGHRSAFPPIEPDSRANTRGQPLPSPEPEENRSFPPGRDQDVRKFEIVAQPERPGHRLKSLLIKQMIMTQKRTNYVSKF